MLEFATCSFQEFRPEMGVPVRSSRGFPRFTLKYPLLSAMPSTFPEASWLRGVAHDRFEQLYKAKIQAIGADRLRAEAQQIREDNARAHSNDEYLNMPIVLLCFERWNDPKKNPEFCHRHDFSRAWREITGEEVPEFGAVPRAEIRAQEQQSPLF